MDPIALRWHNFADGESQSSKRSARSPVQTSPPPPPPLPPPPPVVRRAAIPKSSYNNNSSNHLGSQSYSQDDNYSSSNNNNNNNNNNNSSSSSSSSIKNSSHTKRTLSRSGLEVLREDHPNCFCKLPVKRYYTAEYGPILECGQFRDSPVSSSSSSRNNSIVCGFHVHEYAWKKFRSIVDHGLFLSPDHVELKSCSFFNFTFCTLFDIENEYDCRTPNVPLCSCKRPVIQKIERKGVTPEIVFVCKNADIDGARPKCSWFLPAIRTAFPKPKYRLHTVIDKEIYFDKLQEKIDDIKASKLFTPKVIETTTTSVSSSSSDEEEEEDTTGKTKKNLFSLIPTSVMGKRPRVNRSVGGPESERAALKAEVNRLREELAVKRDKNERLEKERQRTDKLKREIEACQTSNYRLKRERDNSMALALLCEDRIDAIETELSEMEIRRLTKDAQGMEIKDDTNCKKCHERRIEYAVAPCFHFAYCETCASASDLKECIVCGESIIHSQKMYMC